MCHHHDKKICDANFFLDLWRSSFVGLAISSTVRNCVLGIAHCRILEIRLFLIQPLYPSTLKELNISRVAVMCIYVRLRQGYVKCGALLVAFTPKPQQTQGLKF